jgi:methylated-DNA-[protein]-cysteine S-methyltransferase
MVKAMKVETLIRSGASDFSEEAIEEMLRHSREKLKKSLTRIRRPQAAVGVVKSALGNLLVAKTNRGIALNYYLDDSAQVGAAMAKMRLALDPVEDQRAVAEVGEEVDRYLTGNADALRQDIDLTLAGNSFQRKVLDRLQTVPRGAVISYQALGAIAGSAGGARAVGNALHKNPVALYVPCHRVIAADGRIGGYAGGVARKLQLLHSEGFAVDGETSRLPAARVWGHKGTKIYCSPACPTRGRVDRARVLLFAGAEQARRAGMRACKICRPG